MNYAQPSNLCIGPILLWLPQNCKKLCHAIGSNYEQNITCPLEAKYMLEVNTPGIAAAVLPFLIKWLGN